MRITERRLRSIIRQVIKESTKVNLVEERKDVNLLFKQLAAHVKATTGNIFLTLTSETETSPKKFIMSYLGFLTDDKKRKEFKNSLSQPGLKETFDELNPDGYIFDSGGNLIKNNK